MAGKVGKEKVMGLQVGRDEVPFRGRGKGAVDHEDGGAC